MDETRWINYRGASARIEACPLTGAEKLVYQPRAFVTIAPGSDEQTPRALETCSFEGVEECLYAANRAARSFIDAELHRFSDAIST